MIFALSLYGSLVGFLAVAEARGHQKAQWTIKPALALGFILIALMVGVPSALYAQLIFIGLMACAVGDVCLLSRHSQKLFLAGMTAFAVGHLAYLTAFMKVSTAEPSLGQIIASFVTIAFGVGVFSWMRPHVPSKMQAPVKLYFFIIIIMVVNALQLPTEGPLLLAMIGAVMFSVSDVFVGRDRFVSTHPKNALAITPLYFGAQALIALSTHFLSSG